MTYFLPSSIQKRLLRYVLLKTGFLDTDALNLESLDITLGKRNKIELRNVGLQIQQLTSLLQLPDELQIVTARVLLLRIVVPADLYHGSITVEVDGIELGLAVDTTGPASESKEDRNRRTESTRTPQHRKTSRRLRSSSPYDPGGRHAGRDKEAYVPSTQDLAKSFLQEEPSQEMGELQARYTSQAQRLDDSVNSELSEDGALGTGTGLGLPAFLASFLQGIVDRIEVRIKNIEAKLELRLPPREDSLRPETTDDLVSLVLSVESVDVDGVAAPLEIRTNPAVPQPASHGSLPREEFDRGGKRRISLQGLHVDIVGAAKRFEDLSPIQSACSLSSTQPRSPLVDAEAFTAPSVASASTQGSVESCTSPDKAPNNNSSAAIRAITQIKYAESETFTLNTSHVTLDSDRFADASDPSSEFIHQDTDLLDIQTGEDNVSWADRRNKLGHGSESSWTSSSSEHPLDLSQSASASEILAKSVTRGRWISRPRIPIAAALDECVLDNDEGFGRASLLSRDDRPFDNASQNFRRWPDSPDQALIFNRSLSESHDASFQDPLIDKSRGLQSGLPSDSSEDNCEDLGQSRIYTEEEAESMYMSAISEHAPHSPDLRQIPGHWGSNDSVAEMNTDPLSQSARTISGGIGPSVDDLAPTPRPLSPQDVPSATAVSPEVPHDLTPNPSSHAASADDRVVKPILLIDSVELWMPPAKNEANEAVESLQHAGATSSHRRQPSASSDRGQHMPGAFSQYAEQSASVRFESSYMHETTSSLVKASPKPPFSHTLELDVGNTQLLTDLSVLRLLTEATQAIKPLFAESNGRPGPASAPSQSSSARSVSVHLRIFEFRLFKHLSISSSRTSRNTGKVSYESPDNVLLQCKIADFKGRTIVQDSSSDMSLDIGFFTLILGSKEIISFSEGARKQPHTKGQQTPDISIEVLHILRAVENIPVTQMTVNSRILNVNVDLLEIDNVLSSLGGFSGIIELSTSMMSSGSHGPKSPTFAPKKGVRFQEQNETSKQLPGTKINARIAGFTARLSGKTSNLVLSSSAIKFVVRGEYVAASVDTIEFTGPHVDGASSPSPLSVSISDTRVEYFFTPRDADLERLLSLLTPSKNKYENDDDILLDTLLRQRRKGAVLRLNVGLMRINIVSWDFTDHLQALGDEVAKLSAVAKYLPEDDKPGLLILPRVQDLRLQLPVNESFGLLDVHLKDLQAAHIGLPALLAVAIGSIRAGQCGADHIVHDLIPVAAAENLPVFMARMIGDEIEPTCKIKLFNLCLEYSVPVIVALTGVGPGTKAEEMVDLAASVVADLTEAVAERVNLSPTSDSTISPKPPKKLSIDVLFHDCAIGLQPLNNPAKGLLVLNDTRFTTVVPPSDVFEATLELRKASLHVTDSDKASGNSPQGTQASLPLSVRLLSSLASRGFVSVNSIMTARIVIHMTEDEEKNARYVDVEFRDELFLLEACADSMQTLVQVLNGLSPPTPPSKEPKFRTEAMTVEDMMSSFSGDAFEKPQPSTSTMFDAIVDDHSPYDDDDLLAEADLSESIYGLGSGLIDPEDDLILQNDVAGEIAESLLDDDPFEMPDSPTLRRLNDNELLKHLKEQLPPTKAGGALELKPYLITSKQLDRLPGNSSVLGAPYRWNTPNVAFPELRGSSVIDRLPFRLRVRDVHVIFNLYDGYDWQQTRDSITHAVEEVEAKAEERKMRRRRSADPNEEEESVIGDFLFNSIYIGIPANRDPQDLRRQINRDINDLASETESYATSGQTRPSNLSAGQQHRRVKTRRLRLERSKTHKIAFELKGVSADVLVFSPGTCEIQNSVDVRIQDLEIFDNVPTSTWRKFLTCAHDKGEMKEMGKPMVHLELQNVRPVLELAATELVIKVSLLPLRAHADQDAVDFMTRFFEFKDESTAAETADSIGEQPFIQRLDIQTIDLCLDYKPKKVDYSGLRSGKTTEFMNFFILDKANIKLKHAIVYGIRGFDALHPTLSDIWTPDVKRNQLPRILSGLAPVSSLVSIGTGFYDVVAVPVREYKKDGRLVRSVQKGAAHFLRNTTSEIARFGASLAVGTQTVLQGAETMLSPADAVAARHPHRVYSDQGGWTDVDTDEEREQRAVSHYADQPLGVLQGLKSARKQLEHDLLTARDAFIAVQGEVLESGSAAGVAQAVARRAPTIILRPVIGASRAVGQTLMGVGNQVDRGNVRRVEDKYKRH